MADTARDRRGSMRQETAVARRRVIWGALALLAVAAGLVGTTRLSAQSPAPGQPTSPPSSRSRIAPPWRMSVRADNDAFNFWQPITDRPDKEYTNGDEVSFELSAAPLWGRLFADRRRPCRGNEQEGDRCLTSAFSIAQDMYTPRPGHEPRVVADWRDERPYAAWLHGTAEARILSERSLRTVTLSLGVTGPAAAGEFAQRTAHKLTGVYSRQPVGWDTQIGFEPGVIVSLRDSRRFAARTSAGTAVADFVPHVGASVGNVLTEAETGFRARLGVNLSNPWWTSEWRTRRPFELYLIGGLRGEAVARNITLDGNTFGADRRVDRTPLVGEYSIGIGGRSHGFVAEWRAVTRTREYRTGPTAHAHSILFAGYEVPARTAP
jgi:lipid A 3-O-deacylase